MEAQDVFATQRRKRILGYSIYHAKHNIDNIVIYTRAGPQWAEIHERSVLLQKQISELEDSMLAISNLYEQPDAEAGRS